MFKKIRLWGVTALSALWLLAPGGAGATTITAAVTDLTGGQFQFDFVVSGFDFDTNYGFDIYFDPSLYSVLSDTSDASADWDILLLQPDAGLPADGIFDALALVDNATLGIVFRVIATYLGDGLPSSILPFEVFNPEFEVIESGSTVPEPSSFLLLSLGMIGITLRRRAGTLT